QSAATQQPAAGLGDAQPSPEPASSELTGVSAGQTGQPETQPAGEAPQNATSNTHVAGVRSALRARVHRELNRPDVASAAKGRPGAAKIVPTRFLRPKVPPVVQAVKAAPLKKAIDREPEADEPNVAATVWLYRD